MLIEEHAASKGLAGYLAGTTTKPVVVAIAAGATPAMTQLPADPTPVFSAAPSLEEFMYRDGVMRSMIVTNIVDPIGLGVKRDGTAKECWDSVVSACAAMSEAALSLAQSEFQSIKFTGVSRDDLDNLLSNIRSKANVVQMVGGTADEKDVRNVLIRSLPTDPR